MPRCERHPHFEFTFSRRCLLKSCLFLGLNALFLVAVIPLVAENSLAHGIVGNRLFIEPLVAGDANPKNEFDFPVLEAIQGRHGDHVTFNYSLEKKILPKVSVDVEHSFGWYAPNVPRAPTHFGGGDFGFGLKYALYKNRAHEFIMSGKLDVGFPTGDASIGADPFATLSPGFLYAKGFGDLPQAGPSDGYGHLPFREIWF